MIKKFNDFKDTLVVSGFPGVGKTHLFNNKEIYSIVIVVNLISQISPLITSNISKKT